VLFDLGGAFVRYYDREEFCQILEEAIARVACYAGRQGSSVSPADVLAQASVGENHEAPDHSACMEPISSRSSAYPDTRGALEYLAK
jgi:hypothetical protein